jgi:hypothetical protein
MFEVLGPIADELRYHREEGGRHWWDLDPVEEGADCVDWDPMIEVAEKRRRDPAPLSFEFRSPSPWVSSRRSFLTVRSAESPMENLSVSSSASDDTLTLTTDNVRSLVIDGAALAEAGVATLLVDGDPYSVTAEPMAIGPQTGKRPDLHGPLNQVFHRPFCFVWDDSGPAAYRQYAAWLLSWWTFIGNGQGCGLPLSLLDEPIEAEYNLVFLGIAPEGLPISWDDEAVQVGDATFEEAAVFFVYPHGERLRAWLGATSGLERLLFRYVPFSSRSGMPDYFVLGKDGLVASGFFDAEWEIDPLFAEGI